jgi:hypothetical protein
LEYLIKNELINTKGDPIGLAEMVLHLSYEPGILHLIKVLQSPDFIKMCDRYDEEGEKILREVLSVVAHFCNVFSLPKGLNHVLKPLAKEYTTICEDMNTNTLQMLQNFISLFGRNALLDSNTSQTLPVSGISFGDVKSKVELVDRVNVQIRSPFIAMSGFGDDFNHKTELLKTIRSDITLSDELLPLFEVGGQKSSYALDFYIYESFKVINHGYGLHGAKGYHAIKNFNLTLQVLYSTLKTYMANLPKDEVKKEVEEVDESLDWNDFQDETVEKEETIVQGKLIQDSVFAVIARLASKYNSMFHSCEESEFHDYTTQFGTENKDFEDDHSNTQD